MSTLHGSEIEYLKNNHDKKHIICRCYVYTKKTNLLTAGKKSFMFRCDNRTSSFVCSSSISLKTEVLDNVNRICEPLDFTNLTHLKNLLKK